MHPEIMEDVRKESERMMKERDRLLVQLNKQQQGVVVEEEKEGNAGMDTIDEGGFDQTTIAPTLSSTNDATDQSNNTDTFGFREITFEVIAQMKADFNKVIKFILPQQTREQIGLQMKQQILPALKSCLLVAKGYGMTIYDLTRRYVTSFMNMNPQGETGTSSEASGVAGEDERDEKTE